MGRGFDLLIAQLAIAKTGAAWLPFDADTPPERIATCLQDASALMILTDDGCGCAARRRRSRARP